MSLNNYEIYIHADVGITTISELLESENSLFSAFSNDENELLEYDGDTGISNEERIVNMYNVDETEQYINDGILILKPNTQLLVPKDLLEKELLSISGKDQFLEQGSFRAFFGESLYQLLKDPLYRKKSSINYENNIDSYISIFPHISVWIYVGALDSIINVSAYIRSCSINVSKEGGNFDIELPPVVSLKEEDIYFQSVNERHDFLYSANNIRQTITGKNNEFWFHKYIQENDIVFIKFEQLDIEPNEREPDFIINKSALSGQIYDMVGLIDTNTKSISYEANDALISISGRDFTKLLIDDGSYFFPLLFTSGLENNFVNLGNDDRFIKRVFATGDYNSIFAYSLRSITDTIKFIVNQLANLGVVDENVDLFSSYGNRRTKVYRLSNESSSDFEETLHTGVWQIIKLLVDSNISDRRVADPSISNPNSSLIVQFQKICQEPFVEFFGDTYGDFYNFIVRQPPYTKTQIRSYIDGVINESNEIIGGNEELKIKSSNFEKGVSSLALTIEQKEVLSENISWESEQIYSWYELKPQGAFLGNQSNISLAYIPIVYFPQYANKWGCKRLSFVSNYISYQAMTGNNTGVNRDIFRESVINDYKYMIDSYCYLPFTRKGTITINGDRRFKRGTWVRYEATGEIFYIDSVNNSFNISESSIDRTTVLTVSRGMVERYTKGALSYFNIVDTNYIRDIIIQSFESGGVKANRPKTNIKSNFGVNQGVFDFFYERRQLDNII